MKVKMLPHITQFGRGEGGIRRVVEGYNRYLPKFDIEMVGLEDDYDLLAVHAGAAPGADVAHNHGLYWTADLEVTDFEWQANIGVINSLREARQITVPSEWVAETIRRDMRIDPHIIGHGIEWDEWQQGKREAGEYVLWNKNRDVDVCNPEALIELARIFPGQLFLSTFAKSNSPNIKTTGQVPFPQMRQMILECAVYLSSVKETFGIGVLEAMAAGKPILGWDEGGNRDLVKHGVNGYLAQPGNYGDLADGLQYCLDHWFMLGSNGREMAREYTWRKVCEQVAAVYELAHNEPPVSVGVVITVYNKSETEVLRAIDSCLNQSYQPGVVMVVNDGSTDTAGIDAAKAKYSDWPVIFTDQTNQGVAAARNWGIANTRTALICCLDADDWIEGDFLLKCRETLMSDRTIGIAYTGLRYHEGDTSMLPGWPHDYQAAKQLDYEARSNQIPTCCVFRRDAWERVGGYRSRYCPNGAGSEDAAFFSQVLSIGYTAKQVTPDPLFNHSSGGLVGGNPNYREIDWLAWLPFSRDKHYPFACSVEPAYYSHPVRQYDTPVLSIIIPVGPGHETDLRTALDSIEAQHFRNWEVIVVFDTGDAYYPDLFAAYPYVKWRSTTTADPKGPGFARNLGAKYAKGQFLLFLDADDFLYIKEPNSLGEMLQAYSETGNGIYSGHIGRAIISPEDAANADDDGRLVAYNETLGQAYILNHGIEFDCARAMNEPGDDPDKIFIWNLISTLIPREWHFEIGGFDESMATWEDWDYWVRMAKAGRCFTRIQKPFIVYNYISGTRREIGWHIWRDVLQYLKDKHKEIEPMPCCGGAKKSVSGKEMSDLPEDYIDVWYVHRNRGRHHVVYNSHNYGRHSGGGVERFPILKTDFEMDQKAPEPLRIFKPFAQPITQTVAQVETQPATTIPEPPRPIETLDLSQLQPHVQNQLVSAGLTTKAALREMTEDGLRLMKGIGPATAKKIMAMVE
ncbi:MAG: glycosyltransferase [Planctomycetaceae bacterium]|nr:glycosyltransferase [Planctomycetaceae bacterium]